MNDVIVVWCGWVVDCVVCMGFFFVFVGIVLGVVFDVW